MLGTQILSSYKKTIIITVVFCVVVPNRGGLFSHLFGVLIFDRWQWVALCLSYNPVDWISEYPIYHPVRIGCFGLLLGDKGRITW